MTRFPKKLQDKLVGRKAQSTLRYLPEPNHLVDFSSNDYLGLAGNTTIFQRASRLVSNLGIAKNGATGSRLLSGNHPLYAKLEKTLAEFHRTESALVFNSGYDANIGFFGAVPQRGDIVFYDEFIHASIRDGIRLGNAKSYKFKHNDIGDLQKKCRAVGLQGKAVDGKMPEVASGEYELPASPEAEVAMVYIVTESVFSMDGDCPDLEAFALFCQESGYHLVVDEAHAVGVFGKNGEGLVQQLNLHDAVFARIITFGKAMGCHGAAILGSHNLKDYLVNFARSLIYTTGLPPHSVATVLAAYEYLSASKKDGGEPSGRHPMATLSENIEIFNRTLVTSVLNAADGVQLRFGPDLAEKAQLQIEKGGLASYFIQSTSAIHCCVLPGNERVRAFASNLRENGFEVKAILSPTVPQGHERLRICLHSFNTKEEILRLLENLSLYILKQ